MNKATERLVAAINATKKLDVNYFTNTVKKHIKGGCGSLFPDITSVEEAEALLKGAVWEEVPLPVPSVPVWATGLLKAHIPGGVSGMVELAHLPDDTILTWIRYKGPGNEATLVVKGCTRMEEDICYAILAKDGDTEYLLTFHPGEPVDAKAVMSNKYPDGCQMTVAEAKAAGFTYAEYSE